MTKRKAVEELPHPTLITEKPFNVFVLPFELLRDPSWQISTWYRVNAQSMALEKAWAEIAALKQQVATLKEELKEAEEDRDEHFEIAECMLSGHDYMDSINGVVTVLPPSLPNQTTQLPELQPRSLPTMEDENLDPVLRASHVPKNFVVPTIEATSSPPLSILNEDDDVAETHDDANVGEQHVVEHDVEEPETEEQHVIEEPEVGEEQEMEELGAGGYYAAEQQFEDEGEIGLEQEVMEQDVGEQGVMKQDVGEQGVGEQDVVPLDGEEEDDLDAAMAMSMEM
ncbi:hypothetical protein LTR17_011117 [Elasticomyces elasticus]|nr:hypothetical protein LTR17_011117 [Elasticomyces elasticus]